MSKTIRNFTRWAREQQERNDSTGRWARAYSAAVAKGIHPAYKSPSQYRVLLTEKGAGDDVHAALTSVVGEYQAGARR